MCEVKFGNGIIQTELGTINLKSWEGIKVYRGRQIDSENISIEIILNDTQTIAKGQYNIRSNWVHITAENELFKSIEDYFMDDLRDAIEDRTINLD
tara:strand:+ start:760 stop:1047 length:288 start_codon:yes stop_codon:yes gene_type:complete